VKPPRHLAGRPDQPRLHAIEGSAALASPAPRSPHQPPPHPANPTSLPALLAVPEPAQPARLGEAIKEPPPVRLSTTLGFRRVSVAVRHSILPAADGRRRPPAWRLGASGGRRIRATAAAGWGVVAPGARRRSTVPPISRQDSLISRHRSASGDASHRRLAESRRESAGESRRAGTTHTAAARRRAASQRANPGTMASGGHRAIVGPRGPVASLSAPRH
jgi:hypothetical protein